MAAESSLVLLLLIVVANSAKLYPETPFGDVHLNCPGQPGSLGAVTVFYPGYGYVPVCLDGFNRAAAAAVCRQLGFVDAKPALHNSDFIGRPSEFRCEDTPTESSIHISHILCPNVSNYEVEGELHTMRCSVGSLSTATCAKGFAAVECSSVSLKDSAAYRYNGQVRLAPQPLTSCPHFGIAKVIISDVEYSLCWDKMTYFLAHSICRQIGYTNSRGYEPTKDNSTKTVNLLSSCSKNTAGSFPCFSHCINIGNLIKDTNCKEVEIFCEFNNITVLTESPGSPGWCALTIPSTDVGTGGGIVIGIAIGIGIGVILSIIGCIVYKKIRGRAPRHEEDPRQVEDPGPVEEPGERRPLLANGHNNMPQ